MRKRDWRVRLDKAYRAKASRNFKFGSFDCCTAASDLVKAMTGTDPMAEYRGTYKSAAGAVRALGGRSLLQMLISVMPAHGFKRLKGPAMAMKGDIVLTKKCPVGDDIVQAAGICMGRNAIFPGDHGWHSLPMSEIHAAWRV